MGRKKSIQKENITREKKIKEVNGEDEAGSRFDFSLSADAKRNTVGVILFALAILIILGFLGYAGTVGKFLNNISGQAIGWAKLIFPLFLIASGFVLLFKKKTLFYVTKIIGLICTFISIVSFMHWFFPASDMHKMAELGRGGGYLGYFTIYILTKYLGDAGSLVVILTLFLVGIIVAFEFSFTNFINYFKDLFKKKEIDGDVDKNDEKVTQLDNNDEKNACLFRVCMTPSAFFCLLFPHCFVACSMSCQKCARRISAHAKFC